MKTAILASVLFFSSLAQAQQVVELPLDERNYADCSATQQEITRSNHSRMLDSKIYYKYKDKWVAFDICVSRDTYIGSLFYAGYDAKEITKLLESKRNRFYVYTDSEFQQKLVEQRQRQTQREQNQQSRVNNITAKF
jgi:hypothetical protein